MKLVTVEEMLQIERQADAAGLTYELMMENAGRGLAHVVHEEFLQQVDKSVLGLVGSGNNGGDTLVALADLSGHGWRVSAYLAKPRPSDDPLISRFQESTGELYSAEQDPGFNQLKSLLATNSVVLDGVLGTGIRLPLKPGAASVLAAVKQELSEMEKPPQVVAVDCPSGVDLKSGEAAEETIRADLTVTMAAVKTGLLAFPANKYTGRLRVVDIGLVDDEGKSETWRGIKRSVAYSEMVSKILPERPINAHKGTFGTALIIAGSMNYTGAVLLAGEAAYRVGSGLVTLAIPSPLHSALAGRLREATWVLLPHEIGVISDDAVKVVLENIKRSTAVLVGPGLGLEDTTQKFLAGFLLHKTSGQHRAMGFVMGELDQPEEGPITLPPLVIDADALKLLARIPEWSRRLPRPSVLTPHPGEMSVLTGLSTDEIQSSRLDIVERFAREWGHVVVLKGAFTLVASPDGQTTAIPVSTPALARAGTGDVLAGLIVGLLAQGVGSFEAAVAGAWIHAQAGIVATRRLGNTASVLAGDVLTSSIEVINEVLSKKMAGKRI